MENVLLLLITVPLIGCLFVLFAKKDDQNAFYVTLLSLTANFAVVLRLLSQMNYQDGDIQYRYVYDWLESAHIKFSLGVDLFSLIVLMGVHLALLIGCIGLDEVQRKSKFLLMLTLYFCWNISGFFISEDMFSFYMFFAGMLLPLLMLVGKYGQVKKSANLYLFFIFNFVGILCFFAALLVIYRFYHSNVALKDMALVKMPHRTLLMVWLSICAAFVSRVPIWPFHYWLSSINAGIKNPVVSVIINLLPLTGVYGLMRFWELTIPRGIVSLVPVMVMFGVITMIFVALIGTAHKDFMQKLFSYTCVYYLLFLLTSVLLADDYKINIAYSLFTFLIVNSSLLVLDLQTEAASSANDLDYRGILCYMPRLAKIMAFFVLIAVGLPISSLFWNNFVLISALFKENFFFGTAVMASVGMVSMALLYELFMMRGAYLIKPENMAVEDVSDKEAIFFMVIISLVFLSFFNPLWVGF